MPNRAARWCATVEAEQHGQGTVPDRILFVHVPRTGGTTVEQLMREHLPGEAAPVYHTPLLLRLKDPERYSMFYGHVHYAAARPLMPEAFAFTFLREPVERVVSLWRLIEGGQGGRMSRFQFNGIIDCARRNLMFSDFATSLLGGEEGRPVTDDDLTVAMRTLASLDFVGSHARFDEDVRRLFAMWGVTLPDVLPRARPSLVPATGVNDEMRAELARLNVRDTAMWGRYA